LHVRLINAVKEGRAELIQRRMMLSTRWVSASNQINRYKWERIGYLSKAVVQMRV